MDFSQLTEDQISKALKLCDILSLNDFSLATALLSSSQWNLETTINDIQMTANFPKAAPKMEQTEDDISYPAYQESDQFEYEQLHDHNIEKKQVLRQKHEMFEEQYPAVELNRYCSEGKKQPQMRLARSRNSQKDHNYFNLLMENAEKVAEKMLCSKVFSETEKQRYLASSSKSVLNRGFIQHLHKHYKTQLNFTFGTFFLNLTRAYLDEKTLLVYVHHGERASPQEKVTELLLQNREIASFTQKHCVCYGMFDNNDDYEIVHQYLPLKDLPAFALFRFDKITKKEQFISGYSINSNQDNNFMEWVALNIGVKLKKKEAPLNKLPEMKKLNSVTNIKREQDIIYEELVNSYKLKRQISTQKHQNQFERKKLHEERQKAFNEKMKRPEVPEMVECKFRMPINGDSKMYSFRQEDTISVLFEYVDCFCREQFEDQWSDFDLTQSFPFKSLESEQKRTIAEVFEGSRRENLIVKEKLA